MSYEAFARFYDATQGDRAEHASYLRSLIEQYHPDAKTLLELACGTGSVLKQLRPHYEVVGLDRLDVMLALAAEKLPGVRLVLGDMTETRLDAAFDVVLCVYDSINHLLEFAHWEAVFDRAREHLHDGGIFIFDINTQRRLAELVEQPPWVYRFGGNVLVLDVRDGGGGVSIWSIEVFEHVGNSDYRRHAEEIPEVSFPVEQITASLQERFARVRAHDQQRSRPTARSERVHFVCQR